VAASDKGAQDFLYVRDEVIDRVWSTIATEGWNDTKLRAERFQADWKFETCPALCGLAGGNCVGE